MGNIINFSGNNVSINGEPNESLIKLIEDILKLAKEGKLQSLIGTGFVFNGDRIAIWADNHNNIYEMMGALSWLKAEYLERHTK